MMECLSVATSWPRRRPNLGNGEVELTGRSLSPVVGPATEETYGRKKKKKLKKFEKNLKL